MSKKIIIIAFISLLLIQAIVPQVTAEKNNDSVLEDFERLITFETTTNLTIIDELPENPLPPGNSYKGLKAKVEFKYERPEYFPSFLIFGSRIHFQYYS